MGKHVILSHEETMELIAAAQQGDETARERLVECNTRLVWSVVQKYNNRGYEPDDLFQIGAIGLLKAIEKFDMEYGVKFTTYAVPLIVGELQRFIRDDGIIKFSRAVKELSHKIRRGELTDKTPEEIIEALKEEGEYTIDQVKDAVTYVRRHVSSTDEVVYEGKDSSDITLGDQLRGDVNGDWADSFELKEAIKKLEPRERKIVELRYFKDRTQAEAASELGVSQVQVSRLEKKILIKMKELMEVEEVANYTLLQKDQAEKLLKDTDMTLKEVSEETSVPVGTLGLWSKKFRDPKVTAKNKVKGYENSAQAKKDKANRKNKPIETPVINEPAFMGEKDKAKAELEAASIVTTGGIRPTKEINLIGTKTGRFSSDKPNIAGVPKKAESLTFAEAKEIVKEQGQPPTIAEAIKEYEEEIRKQVKEEIMKEMHKKAEPSFIVGLDMESVAVAEVEKPIKLKPTVYFDVSVKFGGNNVSKDQAVESLYEAYNLVKKLPTDSLSLTIVVNN